MRHRRYDEQNNANHCAKSYNSVYTIVWFVVVVIEELSPTNAIA